MEKFVLVTIGQDGEEIADIPFDAIGAPTGRVGQLEYTNVGTVQYRSRFSYSITGYHLKRADSFEIIGRITEDVQRVIVAPYDTLFISEGSIKFVTNMSVRVPV